MDNTVRKSQNALFKGTVTAIPMPTGNSGAEFEQVRQHGADGSVPQATGLSEAAAWNGDSKYESERMHAGRKNGMFRPEYIGAKKKLDFGRGHIFEKPVAECNALIMSIRTGFNVEVVDASREEWRCQGAGWDSICAHLDFFAKIERGKAILNPNFVIGGPEPNYLIVPDAQDHWYIADAKTCRSTFINKWKETDENGIPIGGMANGIAPTEYRQQMLGYMGICHIDGAFLLAHKGGYGEDDFAQVFIPYDKDEAEAILDECERMNQASYKGIIPSVNDCKDVSLAISELPLQFPDVNTGKKKPSLGRDWKVSFDRILEIDKEVNEIGEKIKPLLTEFKNKVKDELGERVASSISIDTETTKKLKKEKADILAKALEVVQDAPGCTFVDDTGDVCTIDFPAGIKWDATTKNAIRDDYPEVYEDLKVRFPERKAKYSRTPAEKAKAK